MVAANARGDQDAVRETWLALERIDAETDWNS
jgi:hypothetical protein